MTYEQQVESAAAALKKGEDANWELARLTYENTNRKGERNAGGVSHAKWSEDVRFASGRRFSATTSNRYSMMWERFGMTALKDSLSWTDAWVELVPRDSGEAMRERATDTHITKEASPERKREIFQTLAQDPDVLSDITTESAARTALRQLSEDRAEQAEARNAQDDRHQKLAKMGHQLDASSDIGKARRLLIHALDELSQLEPAHLDEIRPLLLRQLGSVEVAASWLRDFLSSGDRSWDEALADILAAGE